MANFDLPAFVDALQALLESVPPDPEIGRMAAKRRRSFLGEIEDGAKQLRLLVLDLDPIKQPDHVFDPSDPRQMGRLIAQTLLAQERERLSAVRQFYGSGVYAIYYKGDFPVYEPISGTETPIYIGKVDPATPDARSPVEQEARLWRRLVKDHAANIKRVKNLDVSDFTCRYLVVKSAWQNTAEEYLIDRFKPVWNNEVKICYGFGKHGDSPGTRSNRRSPWDTLHPGRRWAWAEGNVPNPKSADEIAAEIKAHFGKHEPEREKPSLI